MSSLRRERCRGADALKLGGTACLADAANEHGHVGALAPAVRVKLVEHQESQRRHGVHQFDVVVAGEDELGHHVVGEQHVGWVVSDRLSLGCVLLAGEHGEGHWSLAVRPIR